MKPIILKVDADGKILISAEEIQKMVEEAYQQGREDEKKNACITYSPPPTVVPPNWYETTPFTCGEFTTATSKPHGTTQVWN